MSMYWKTEWNEYITQLLGVKCVPQCCFQSNHIPAFTRASLHLACEYIHFGGGAKRFQNFKHIIFFGS